jgi:MFS family permease
MSGNDWYPPPGGGEPPRQGPPPPGHTPAPPLPPADRPAPQAAAPAWAPAPGMLGAAHKPGALPLRPLGLGDMYDAAVRIIRFNPKATVGSAVLVAAVAMAIPVLITALLTWTVDLSLDDSSGDLSRDELLGVVGSFGSLALGSILQSIGLVLVTGMIAHVTAAAAIGRRLTLAEAWRATHGKRWKLIGLTFLLGLLLIAIIGVYALTWVVVVLVASGWQIAIYGLVSVPLFLCFLCWFWIRVYYLPVPALMLEDVGVLGAVGRGFRLTGRQFWRTFGIALLTVLIAQIAGGMLAAPVSILGQVVLAGGGPVKYAVLGLVVTNALTNVISAAFVAPFTTTVASLQYFDQRMRKEAYDVELMARAGITPS